MRRCLDCGERFDERRRVCPKDGDILLSEGHPSPDTGRILDGRYRLGNLIGEGGMGQVFEGTILSSNELVAIKILRPGLTDKRIEKRFQREAEAMEALDHPGVARIIDFRRTSDGLVYMAMERLFGPTFTELRRAGKFASPDRVVQLMIQACEVVASAHAKGIIHRDVKPSNLLLHRVDRDRSQVKVLDFGIVKFLGKSGDTLTSSGELVGTVMYMAPEQSGGGHLTPAVDVYSLGAVLFEALAGRLPFAARNMVELIRLQTSSPTPALSTFRPDISSELDEVVARCLSKKPENRYQDADALADALGRMGSAEAAAGSLTRTSALRINPSLWVGSVLDDRYELHEWLSPGRFGSQVYLATHLRTGAHVAVRFWGTGKGAVRDLLIEAFRSEARAMGVRHANLISIVDLGFNDDGVYLVTELVESVSLRELLDKRGTLPGTLASRLAAGAARGLGALHAAGIVSGGLSPETIRVTGPTDQPERMLISPFGLTNIRQLRELLDTLGPISDGEAALDYIAPEQRSGAPPAPRSDLYSLGLVLLEMLGGGRGDSPRPPARTLRAEEVTAAPSPIQAARAPSLPEDVGEDWSAFFLRAVAHEPEKRFQTAEEFVAALPYA